MTVRVGIRSKQTKKFAHKLMYSCASTVKLGCQISLNPSKLQSTEYSVANPKEEYFYDYLSSF